MSERWVLARIDEVEGPPLVNAPAGSRLRSHFGIESFGVNAWRADPGADPIPEHDEAGDGASRHEEVYVVLSGRATFEVGGETIEAKAGDFLFGPRDVPHRYTAGPDGCRQLFIMSPGGFENLVRERSVPAQRRTLPPPPEGEPDWEHVAAVGQANGCELLG